MNKHRRSNSYKIGITGNIATGKTLVLNTLQRNGVSTLDAEEAALNVLSDNPQKLSIRISDHFESGVLDARGRLYKKKLAQVLYANPQKKRLFDEQLAPLLREEMKHFLYGAAGGLIRAVESPSILEDDAMHLFDEVWLVTAESDLQIQRLRKRNGLTLLQAGHLVDLQWGKSKKAALCHRVIDNSFDIYQTEKQVREVLDEIKRKLFKTAL